MEAVVTSFAGSGASVDGALAACWLEPPENRLPKKLPMPPSGLLLWPGAAGVCADCAGGVWLAVLLAGRLDGVGALAAGSDDVSAAVVMPSSELPAGKLARMLHALAAHRDLQYLLLYRPPHG